MARQVDIAIIGGGLVGASLACALAPTGMRIAVVEAVARQAAAQPSYDDRTLALSDSSCRILAGLGLWPALRGEATPIRRIVVTELDRPGRVELDPAELRLDAFGHVVEARVLGRALVEAMDGLDAVEVICPARVAGLELGAEAVSLALEGGADIDALDARLVVAADGADSTVRELLGIATERRDYAQTAVICNITPEAHHEGRAFERFTPSGPFAVLPHVGDRCGLVWTVSSADAPALLALPEDEFLAAAQARFGDELGAFQRMGRRASYPLRLVRATGDTAHRVAIIGNAAHAIHPVGAQGFNLGLRDAAVLAEVLTANGGDPGEMAALQRYSAWRRTDQDDTVGWSDGLARLYANPGRLAAAVRTAGLLAHALVPPLRRELASRMMGYRGRMPALALSALEAAP